MPRGTNPLDRAKVQGRLWTPDINQGQKFCEFYAGDLSTISASGDTITNWADRSRKGYDGSSVNGTPKFSLTSFLGKEGITFSSGQYLTLATNPATATCSCVAVCYPTTISGNQFIAGIGGSGAIGNGSSICANISASSKWGSYSGSAYISANSGLSINTPYILIMDGTGAGLDGGTFWKNGVSDGTYGTIGSTSSSAGSRISNTAGIVGVLRYLLWYNVALNSRLRQLFEGWAAWDSGIVEQCLPADHPFRNRPPMIGD